MILWYEQYKSKLYKLKYTIIVYFMTVSRNVYYKYVHMIISVEFWDFFFTY